MPFIAILGAGAIGGALAHRLAARDRVRDVRLIDSDASIARGKALDILQSAPIDGFSTRVSAAEHVEAAVGADVVVIADAAPGNAEHAGEQGLALVRRLVSLEQSAPLVFAGPGQRELMSRTRSELHVAARRVIGSAPGALESAVRALVALEVRCAPRDVQVLVLGAPPAAALVAWEGATVHGEPVSRHVPPHRLAAISSCLRGLWPPGPQALASAASRAVEAIVNAGRGRYTCFVVKDEPPGRDAIVAMPVELGPGGITRVLSPALSRQEQTLFENALVSGLEDRR